MSADRKKLFIKTWGCQMNVYDSRRMADILAPMGYAATDTPDDADMVILNTCHIREKATDKVFSEIGRLRDIKDDRKAEGKKTVIAVAGCVAQAEGDYIMERAPSVDMVFGPQAYHELPEMLLKAGVERIVNTQLSVDSKFDALPEESLNHGPSAFLSVQEGCDKFCTFCVVPYTRGAEFSRPVMAVLNEAQKLADTGAREITLLGQNVNAYHGEGPDGKIWSLARIIEEIAKLSTIERIRYTTSHPQDMRDDLIDAHTDIPKLMPYMHLPVQSGSDRILKAMNRKHKAEMYLDILERVKKARPGIALSSDFIVGFPGETDQDFEDTMALVAKVGYQSAYSFKYSPRPGTPAAAIQAAIVREDVKQERLVRLQALLTKQFEAFNEGFIGKTVPVLVERPSLKNGLMQGRSPHNQSVNFPGEERLIGQIVDVAVDGASATALRGNMETVEILTKTA
ncbi:MAG: tRNA (N6-isopentenyl adenosine(37)-C2)-methylthiotransferase MiaB [Micavibrio aeruginosavorus]|uniref:tRNA-2-methylthio-N(6)-dimethylallyladenosine synthase n=1 Tax=Micavibrio aeruginosavorus TaxID=349221 RepID=A0A2W5MSU5_9BACT|nr:MAG: tRNA (N6-isopentenyl adenosine(37)-C2)-methylthiotransferase MiaB [Micavibrio aeruginosavorus]